MAENQTGLNQEDITDLLKALDALDAKPADDSMVTMLLGTILSSSKEQAAERLKKHEAEREAKAHIVRAAKEKNVLLRAKLILLRRDLDGVDADRVFDKAATPQG